MSALNFEYIKLEPEETEDCSDHEENPWNNEGTSSYDHCISESNQSINNISRKKSFKFFNSSVKEEKISFEDGICNKLNTNLTSNAEVEKYDFNVGHFLCADSYENVPSKKKKRPGRFGCDICGKIFAQRDNLKMHSLIHSGQKPFECLVCGRTFSQKGNLKTHSLTHSGLRPFKCNLCGSSFSQKGNLKTHMLTHSGERPFGCLVCGKAFYKSNNLKRHMLIHSSDS